MRIDLQCPVEVWRCILPDEPKEPCELILFNLGDKVIVSVEVTMILTDEHGSEISRVVERAHDMNGQPGENFSMLMELPDSMVKAGCKACVMEVSSQALMMDRTAGLEFEIGVFTNISPDHIGPEFPLSV